MKMPWYVPTLGVLGIVFLSGMIMNTFGFFSVEQVDPATGEIITDGGGQPIIIEDNPDEITLTFNDIDMEDRSNDPAGVLRLYDPDKGNVSDGGTKTLALKTDYKAIAEFGSTTYYAQVVNFNSGTNKQLTVEPKVAKTGTLTVSAFNSDDDQPNSASDTQAVSADDEDLEMKICYDTVSNIYFGAPQAEGQSVVVIAYNQSEIDSVEVVDASRGNAPADYARVTANMTAEEAWKIPNVVDGIKQCIMLNIDATSTETASGKTLTLSFYDANVDLDLSKYLPIYDIEDEDNNLLSIQATNKTIYLG